MLSDFWNPLSKRNFTLFGLWLIHFYWFKHILEDKEGCLICYLAQILGRNKNRNFKKMGDVEKLWYCGNLHDILQPKSVFWRKWEYVRIKHFVVCNRNENMRIQTEFLFSLGRVEGRKSIFASSIFSDSNKWKREIHTSFNLSERIFYS